MERFAIVGFGCAGYHALRAIREAGCCAEIDVYSDTELPPYNPMLTTYYVKGKIPFEAMFPFGSMDDIKKAYSFTFRSGCAVASADAAERLLRLADGTAVRYDKLLIATGARAFSPPVGSLPAERQFSMRCVEDAKRLKAAVDSGKLKRALVVGASMVGIKIVELLLEKGIEVVFSDLADHIFPTAAFDDTSERIEGFLRAKGVELKFGVKTEEAFEKDGRCEIHFSDGSVETADAAVVCIGTRAVTGLLDPKQVKVNRGVVVDEHMRTTADGVYAAGDCCEGNDLTIGATRIIGLWANAGMQGETAGKCMAGLDAFYAGNILHNITHFCDIDFVSFGDKSLPGERRVFLDEGGRFAEATVDNGSVKCVNLLNVFKNSGAVKNFMMRALCTPDKPLDPQMRAVLIKSGLPRELTDLLGGGVLDRA